MKKPSIGLIIFGIIFVLIGAQSLQGVFVYFAHKEMAALAYKAVTMKIIETEKLMEKQKNEIESTKLAEAQAELQQIRNEMAGYKEKYVKGGWVPLPMIIFIISTLFVAVIFAYTGISILQLKYFARNLISMSFLAGLIYSFMFIWSAGSGVFFITNLTDRFSALFAALNGAPLPKPGGISAVINIFTSAHIRRIFFVSYMIYIAFMSTTSIFFARPKIKELFK